MNHAVKLSDVAGELEILPEDAVVFFDRQTGEFQGLMEGMMPDEDDEDDGGDEEEEFVGGDWELEMRELGREIANDTTGRYVKLPDRYDINEWDMMERFAARLEDAAASAALLEAIRGRGAFRFFKARLHDLGYAETWYAFRTDQYREIARDWCAANNIEVAAEDETSRRPRA